MFLKNVNKQAPSIGYQLTFFYAVSMFLLLLLSGFLLYIGTMHILYKADYEFLADEVETISYVLKNKSYDKNILHQVVVDTPTQSNRSLYRYFVRIYNEHNQIIAETPGMQVILPPTDASTFDKIIPNKTRYIWYKKNNNQYLLIQSPVTFGNHRQSGAVEIILDIAYQHNAINDKRILIALTLLAGVASLFLGFVISFRGMSELKRLTQKVKTISASSLHQRIDPSEYPSELQELAQAFNSTIENIENAVKRLQQFTGDLAHELRSPITNLIGETEMAINYTHSLDDCRAVLSSNLEELHRISSLIENILFLARAENPKRHIIKEMIDAHAEIRKIIDYFEPMSDEKNISFTLDGEGQCYFNQIMFDRMMSNLISNAIKYTHQYGHIHISINQNKTNTVIQIRDTGEGIPAEHLPNIFNRFYRVDSSRTKNSGGIGLGLAIVKSIVDLHQGSLLIESEPAVGTLITLNFHTSADKD